MSRILGIGIATLDIIHHVDHYPVENSEQRALGQVQQRGGNVTNTLTVLSQLGHHCSWAGSYGDDLASRIICADLQQHGIDYSASHCQPGGRTPLSLIIRNEQNGSRTIVHYRDLDEFRYEDFCAIDLGTFDWLHFEGRNISTTRAMLEHARRLHPDLPCSVEIEKPRPDIAGLFPLASVLVFSQDFITASGRQQAETFLQEQHARLPGIDLVATWGEDGAYFFAAAGSSGHCPAFVPAQIVDTLGAGDTFNAGLIDALLNKDDLAVAVRRACRLAGRKCGHAGFDFIHCH